jgi:hypothetical protein
MRDERCKEMKGLGTSAEKCRFSSLTLTSHFHFSFLTFRPSLRRLSITGMSSRTGYTSEHSGSYTSGFLISLGLHLGLTFRAAKDL